MSIAPGWYKDPAEPTTQRWWDGEGWVGDPLPADTTPPPGPPPPAADRPDTGPDSGGADPPSRADPVSRADPAVPAAEGAPPRPHGYRLATLGQRLVARLVDVGLVLVLNVLVNSWFVYELVTEVTPLWEEIQRRMLAGENLSNLPETSDRASTLMIVILIIAAALWFAYEIPAVANNGQTPGKRLLGIKVVQLEQDQPLGFGRSFRRWNTMGLPVLLWGCLGVGFLLQLADALVALFDRPLQQALHDKSAHTAVVAAATEPGKENPDAPADPS